MSTNIEYNILEVLKHINNHVIDLINKVNVLDKRLIKSNDLLESIKRYQ